ncbi:hypothetical protein H6G94_04520 [Nostoc punctiforme FACHB-252]|uniref:Uncharacterized protein n=1 Tax=Nostoc punctiforme FACHB-252 TaxID=1357509 RepID=A0ABR8H641_NOSPU|nr:hypothetical protein [Nostoc punctiforme]MBD2610543.1 hypothetical protein [Nostoc punctiforme FACHB-252]
MKQTNNSVFDFHLYMCIFYEIATERNVKDEKWGMGEMGRWGDGEMGRWEDGGVWGVWGERGERFLHYPPTPPTPPTPPACPMPNAQCPMPNAPFKK